MVKQNNLAQVDLFSFFQNGALLQVASDQFKMILGPFQTIEVSPSELMNHIDQMSPVIYQPDFWDFLRLSNQKMKILKGQSCRLINRKSLIDLCSSSQLAQPQVAWQNVLSESFKKQFDWSQQQFKQKKLLKTVPIILQKCQTRFTQYHLAYTIQKLLSETHYGWAYGFWQNGTGYLGQSPELILDWNNSEKKLKTSALAGTLKNTELDQLEILKNEKIQDEHQIVVQDIFEKLKKIFTSEQIIQNKTEVLKLKYLIHLKTEFKCCEIHFQEALKAIHVMHPTAALGLYPASLDQYQNFSELSLQNERGSFAAPFAFISSNEILCLAAIRSFHFTENEIQIFSGCGVTAQSSYESELLELELKRQTVKRMMGIEE